MEQRRSVAVLFAAWFLGRGGKPEIRFTKFPARCPRCGSETDRGLWVRGPAGSIRCLNWTPVKRRRACCRPLRPVDGFEVSTRLMIVGPYCRACARVQYHRTQISKRFVARSRTCTKCGREFAAREGYVGRSRRTGIRPECRRCVANQ